MWLKNISLKWLDLPKGKEADERDGWPYMEKEAETQINAGRSLTTPRSHQGVWHLSQHKNQGGFL